VNCGKKSLSQRVHQCSDCGYTTDRDVAAAQVVKKRGISTVGSTGKRLIEGKDEGLSLGETPSVYKPRIGDGDVSSSRISL